MYMKIDKEVTRGGGGGGGGERDTKREKVRYRRGKRREREGILLVQVCKMSQNSKIECLFCDRALF